MRSLTGARPRSRPILEFDVANRDAVGRDAPTAQGHPTIEDLGSPEPDFCADREDLESDAQTIDVDDRWSDFDGEWKGDLADLHREAQERPACVDGFDRSSNFKEASGAKFQSKLGRIRAQTGSAAVARLLTWDTKDRRPKGRRDRMHLVTLETAEGRVAQRSTTTPRQHQILQALEIAEPARFYDFELPEPVA
jgi:hypothetical protein